MMLPILILCMVCGSQEIDSTLTISINDNSSEWFYIIPSAKTDNQSVKVVQPDRNGVIYLNKKRYRALKKVIVLQNEIDVTDNVKFLAQTSHNTGQKGKYELYKFFLSSSKKPPCCPELEWDNPDVHYKYSRQEKEHREKLLKEGKLKLN